MGESFEPGETAPERLMEALREAEGELAFDLRRAILESGADVVAEGLVEIATDDTLRVEDPDTYGPPAHAAALLGMVGADETAEALAELVRREGDETAVGEASGRALQNLGVPAGLEAAFEAYEAATSDDGRRRLVEVLAGFRTSDERILDALDAELGVQPPDQRHHVLLALERYGDPAGVETVEEWIAETEPDPDEPTDRYLIDLAANVVRALGGEVTGLHAELLDEARGVEGPEGEGMEPVDF